MRFYVLLMFHSENIVILTILLRYFDISVVGFVMLFGYCISAFEHQILHQCTCAVYTYIVPSPKHQLYQLQWHSPRHKNKLSFDQNHAHSQGESICGKKVTFPNKYLRLPAQVTFINHVSSPRDW